MVPHIFAILLCTVFAVEMFLFGSVLGLSTFAATPQTVRLESFMEKVVPDCARVPDPEARRRCETDAKRARREFRGATLEVLIEDDLRDLSQVGAFDSGRGAYPVEITPLFAAGDTILSAQRPKRLTRDGRPVSSRVRVWVKTQDGRPDFAMERTLKQGRWFLRLSFSPGKPWKVGRGRRALRGYSAKFRELRIHREQGEALLGVRRW